MFKVGDGLNNNEYSLIEELSRGNKSVTFRATRRGDPNPEVVIKIISRKENAAIIASAERGAEVLKDYLSDDKDFPKFITEFDTRSGEDEYACFVKEFVQGTPLSKELEDRQELKADKVYNWVLQLCGLLEKLHNKSPQILFMNIKPENIVVRPGHKIALVDFSSAVAVAEGQEISGITITPEYADPVLIGSGAQPDVKTEIFNLGMVIQRIIKALPDEEKLLCDPLLSVANTCCDNREVRYETVEELKKEVKRARHRSARIKNGEEGIEYETDAPARLGTIGFLSLATAIVLIAALGQWIKIKPERMERILIKIKSPQIIIPFMLVFGLMLMRMMISQDKRKIIVRRAAILSIPMDLMVTSLAYVATTVTILAKMGSYYSLLLMIMFLMTMGVCYLSGCKEKEIFEKGFFFGDNAGYTITIFLIAFTAFGMSVLL